MAKANALKYVVYGEYYCPLCNGSGKIDSYNEDDELIEENVKCLECGGSGRKMYEENLDDALIDILEKYRRLHND